MSQVGGFVFCIFFTGGILLRKYLWVGREELIRTVPRMKSVNWRENPVFPSM